MLAWSGVRCGLAYGPVDATATPSSLGFIKIQTGSAFLVLAYPRCF